VFYVIGAALLLHCNHKKKQDEKVIFNAGSCTGFWYGFSTGKSK
jgi:predicted phosphodiesterase